MIARHKGEIPFLILLIPFTLGIGLCISLPSGYFTSAIVIAIVCLTAFLLFGFGYERLNLFKLKWAGGAVLHGLLFALGFIAASSHNELSRADHFSKTRTDYLLATINNEPKISGGLVRFIANVDQAVAKGHSIDASGNLMVTIKDSMASRLTYGDRLLIPNNFKPVEGPVNPAEFNYRVYLAYQNIHYQSFLFTGQYRVVGHNGGNRLIAFSLQLRRQLVARFKQHMHNPEAIAVASTLIFGYKADLSQDILQAYSKTGTIHVLSVSGAHVAIVFLLLNVLMGFMNLLPHGRIIKAVVIIGCIWYYSLLTGFSPAVCRAAVMISMVIIGKTYSRHINTLNILAVSAFGLLLYNPYFIADVGFQLSYLAVFGLIVLQPIVYKWLDIRNKWLDKIWQLCSVSIAAQVITFPLSIFYFHQFPVYFLLSNLLIIIPTTVIMYAGIGCLLFGFVPAVSAAFAHVLEWSILAMNRMLAAIEHAPYSGVSAIWITTLQYVFLFVLIITLFMYLHKRRPWLLTSGLTSLLLFCSINSFGKIRSVNTDEIIVLKLRKHTGIIFRHGDQAVVETDLTDTSKMFRYSIQPYLDSCGIDKPILITANQDVNADWFIKKGPLIRVFNKTAFIPAQTADYGAKLIKADYLFISGGEAAKAVDLLRLNSFGNVIIDNNNAPSTVKSITETADRQHLSYCTCEKKYIAIKLSN